jgi:hypothetical protein
MWYGLGDGSIAPASAAADLAPTLTAALADYQARVALLVQTMEDLAAELRAAAACSD